MEIARQEAIKPLVELGKSGSEELKTSAGYALRSLAGSNNKLRAEITREGGKAALTVVKPGSDEQKAGSAKIAEKRSSSKLHKSRSFSQRVRAIFSSKA